MSTMTSHVPTRSSSGSSGNSAVKEEDDELTALGGGTRLVPRKSPSVPASPDSARLHETPSPHNSPVQPYLGDHGHGSHGPNVNGQGGGGSPMGHWHPYQPHPEDPYANYYSTAASSQWSPETQYAHIQTSMMASASIQYPPYEQLSPVGGPYVPSHSPVETQIHGDPQASWHSFYAPYQAGMAG